MPDTNSHVSNLNARIRELESLNRSVAPESRIEATQAVRQVRSSVTPSPRSTQSVDQSDIRSPAQGDLSSRGSMLPPETELGPNYSGTTSLPSNAQLIGHISTAHELPFISGDRNVRVGSEGHVSVDLSTLPPEDQVAALIDHHISYTNSAFPVLHEPTFREQARNVRSNPEACTPAHACMLYRESVRRKCYSLKCSRARRGLHVSTALVSALYKAQTHVAK